MWRAGMLRLKSKYIVAALSNGNVSLADKHGEARRYSVGLYLVSGTRTPLQNRQRGIRDSGSTSQLGSTVNPDGRSAQPTTLRELELLDSEPPLFLARLNGDREVDADTARDDEFDITCSRFSRSRNATRYLIAETDESPKN